MAKTEKTFFADFYEGGQKSVIVLEDNVNYQFKLFLDTPYKWGAGFNGSSESDIKENEKAFYLLRSSLNGDWDTQVGECFGSAPSWWNKANDVEEIYAHPMELSGVLNGANLKILLEKLQTSDFPVTKFKELRVFGIVKEYKTADLCYEFREKIGDVVPKVYEAYKDALPLNFDFNSYFGFKFKKYAFVKESKFNQNQNNQIELLSGWLNRELVVYKAFKNLYCQKK